MLNGIKIMNLEGSDILKNNLENISIEKDYKGAFADSLLSEKLIELGLDIIKDTTKDIIMVNFNFGYTPKLAYSLISKIQVNKEEIEQLAIVNRVLMEYRKKQKKNKDKAIFTKSISINKDKIYIYRQRNTAIKEQLKAMNIKADEIRTKLYKEGFHLDFYKKEKVTGNYKLDKTIEYTFFFRSPSKSKTGDVCFINKKLFNKINEWQTMGIKLPPTNAKLVEMEAYKSLTSSHIESKIIINPYTEILTVNDLDSYTEKMCTKVFVKNKVINPQRKQHNIKMCKYKIIGSDYGNCASSNEVMKIKNTLFDGQALLDDSLFDKTDNCGMKVLRQHFFKACGFRTFISKFFIDYCSDNKLDYNKFTVKDKYDRDILVKNVKCITTENAMKWEKFKDLGISYDYWCEKVKEDNNLFGVCKTDHISKYNEYQRLSFQMINTLPIDRESAIKLCEDTVEYVNKLKNDNEAFIRHLNTTKSSINSNEMMMDLYKHNNNFANSELFRKYKSKTISEYKETLRAGKLLANGDNLTVIGNPYTMLLHSVGALDEYITNNVIEGYEDITLPKLEKGIAVYTKRFESEELASFRSPHNATSNIGYNVNFRNELMDKYFNFSDNIMAVNCIETEEQDRKNSQDFDSDFNFVTNSSIAVQASKKAQEYYTIVNCIDQSGKKYDNTMEDLARIDNGLAKSRYSIGLSSNMAQLAMSWYWKNQTKELSDIVAICSVLAQCSIDNSKRLYQVNLECEISRINKLECMQVKINSDKEIQLYDKTFSNDEKKAFKKMLNAKPYFWQFIKDVKEDEEKKINEKDKDKALELKIENKQEAKAKKKDKIKDLEKHCLVEKICPMDFIQEGIDLIEDNKDNSKYTNDIDFVQSIEGKASDKQQMKIEGIVKNLDDMYKKHYDNISENKDMQDEDGWKIEQLIKSDESVQKIGKLKLAPKTMQMLISNTLCNNAKNKKYKRRMLNCLYKAHKELFLSVFKMSEL